MRMTLLFPHEKVRKEQQKVIAAVEEAINKGTHVVAHAPTGLGKTAAVLAPALTYADTHDVTIWYLTSRHTQHRIILETIENINKKFDKHFIATSIIGKKNMCLQEGVSSMRVNDFLMFCKHLRNDSKCNYYLNTRVNKTTIGVEVALAELTTKPAGAEQLLKESKKHELCPYEVGLMLAERAHVIISDYFYAFHPSIRESFLKKIDKKLGSIILVIDEGHNVPSRLRDLQTYTLSSPIIRGAITEAKNLGLHDLELPLQELVAIIEREARREEQFFKKDAFVSAVNAIKEYDLFAAQLSIAGEAVLETQKQSRISWIASFLEAWKLHDKGFARILRKQGNITTLTLRCLDPSLLSKDVLTNVHSSILMSGTLTPTHMYSDLLGYENPTILECKSPFPEENRLPLIIPKTTTKYSQRSPEQYKRIAAVCAQLGNTIPGNVLIFFPSYALRDNVYEHFENWYENTILLEQPGLSREERQGVLDKFTQYKEQGAALLAVSSGSFGEGIDLPGVIKGVFIVGLPLERPDLEMQELIKYYDNAFGKGWEYGYTLPAMSKTFQNAGRCIRTETDYGVFAFIDERYAWEQYRKNFPSDWKMKFSEDPLREIEEFFEKRKVMASKA